MNVKTAGLWLVGALAGVVAAAGLGAAAFGVSPLPSQAAFAAENKAAMTKMMAGMHVDSTGDIDRDFATMMIAHHQGAIDMALAELRYGRNAQLRRLAQEIIVEQQQEIRVMQMALDTLSPASRPHAPHANATLGAAVPVASRPHSRHPD